MLCTYHRRQEKAGGVISYFYISGKPRECYVHISGKDTWGALYMSQGKTPGMLWTYRRENMKELWRYLRRTRGEAIYLSQEKEKAVEARSYFHVAG